MKKRKFTLSVGIPVFNEEGNIRSLVQSILEQNRGNYILEKIYIVSDGSTDGTDIIINSFSKNKIISSKIFKERKGKIKRLNYIYEVNKSDLLLTLDGDIGISSKFEINKMVTEFYKNNKLVLAVPNQLPIRNKKSFISSIIYSNYVVWDEIRKNLNHGDSIYNSFGVASMLRKDFSKSFIYPEFITNDGGFLYMKAKKYGQFKFLKYSKIYYIAVSNIKEMRMFFSRSLNERVSNVYNFEIDLYRMPAKYKYTILMKNFTKHPLVTISAIFINVYLKIHKHRDNLQRLGMWETVFSTKKSIIGNV